MTVTVNAPCGPDLRSRKMSPVMSRSQHFPSSIPLRSYFIFTAASRKRRHPIEAAPPPPPPGRVLQKTGMGMRIPSMVVTCAHLLIAVRRARCATAAGEGVAAPTGPARRNPRCPLEEAGPAHWCRSSRSCKRLSTLESRPRLFVIGPHPCRERQGIFDFKSPFVSHTLHLHVATDPLRFP
jgi:hypothetical protein